MARDISPKFKKSRREGVDLYPDLDKSGTAKSPLMRKNYKPGMHGPKLSRAKLSNYGRQLREKQKAKRIYGILERQFQNYYKKAIQQKGDTGEVMLSLLERRLDNVVYLLCLAKTRAAARQLVAHGNILIDDKKVNIPSYQVKEGEVVKLKEKLTKNEAFLQQCKNLDRATPGWLAASKFSGKVVSSPELDMAKSLVDMRQIVEFYSR